MADIKEKRSIYFVKVGLLNARGSFLYKSGILLKKEIIT